MNVEEEPLIEKELVTSDSESYDAQEDVKIVLKPDEKKKRKDIQGLRGIAIVAVLSFHLLPAVVKNGFLGVDIFFVLSGYLMASILSRQESITFSVLLDFYTRRFKRIVPLYALVLVGITAAVPFIFLRSDIPHFVDALLWAMPFAENLKLILQTEDYFSQVFNFNVLLHTWSLGVEIQWYLIVPFVVKTERALADTEYRTAFTLILATGSLYVYLFSEEKVAFSFLFSRVWQFLLGSLAHALSEGTSLPGGLIANTVYKFGIASLAILVFYNDAIPTNVARITCTLLTGALLYGGSFVSSQLLSNRLFVYIGDISYVLYLVHWPIIVYTKYYMNDKVEIGRNEIVFCLVTTVILSVLIHHSFEACFIRATTRSAVIVFFLLYSILFVAVTTPLLGEAVRKIRSFYFHPDLSAAIEWNERAQHYDFPAPSGMQRDLETEKYHKYPAAPNLEGFMTGNGTASILMIGNSFALGAFHAILASYEGRYKTFRLYAEVGCSMFQFLTEAKTRQFSCRAYDESWKRVIREKRPDAVIIVARDGMLLDHRITGELREDPFFINVTQYMDFICSHAKIVVLQSHTVQPLQHASTNKTKDGPAATIAKRLQREGEIATFDDLVIPYDEFEKAQHDYRRMIFALNYSNLIIDDIGPLMCDEDKKCRMYNPRNLHAYYADMAGHFTDESLDRLMPHLKEVASQVLKRIGQD